ncbi:hypothetical protein JCM3774_000802, partial [Rhodotorula dairenensis]
MSYPLSSTTIYLVNLPLGDPVLIAEARLAKEARKAAAAAASQPGSARNSRPSTPNATTTGSSMSIKKVVPASQHAASSAKSLPPPIPGPVNALRADMEAMGLGAPEQKRSLLQAEQAQKQAHQQQQQRQRDEEDAIMAETGGGGADGEAPVLSLAKEKILEEVRVKEKTEKPVLSLVVVGAWLPAAL